MDLSARAHYCEQETLIPSVCLTGCMPRRICLRVTFLSVALWPSSLDAPSAQSSHEIVHTTEVDLAYETLGTDRTLPPVFAVDGGPGLTHAYMVQNDLWNKATDQYFLR